MKITKQWLEKNNACADGEAWVLAQDTDDAETLVKRLLDYNLSWVNWLLPRCLTYKNRLKYRIYASESVLVLFEDKYPDDNRPRLAIAAAKKVLEKNTKENRLEAVRAARLAEDSAGRAARSASARAAWADACERSAAASAKVKAYVSEMSASARAAAAGERLAAESAAAAAAAARLEWRGMAEWLAEWAQEWRGMAEWLAERFRSESARSAYLAGAYPKEEGIERFHRTVEYGLALLREQEL